MIAVVSLVVANVIPPVVWTGAAGTIVRVPLITERAAEKRLDYRREIGEFAFDRTIHPTGTIYGFLERCRRSRTSFVVGVR
jgi:hypothetical protein